MQHDLLQGFFEREQRFFLTGGAAPAGFYFSHRDTEDLDLFSTPGPDLAEAARTMADVAHNLGATVETRSAHLDFHRMIVRRGGDEECIVDLVIDRAPLIEPSKSIFRGIRVDTPREIAANKIRALISRSEIKDLVDLHALVEHGIDLHQAFSDAQVKEAGADPATLAWILDQMLIGPNARLPAAADPAALERFRADLVRALRSEAFKQARRT